MTRTVCHYNQTAVSLFTNLSSINSTFSFTLARAISSFHLCCSASSRDLLRLEMVCWSSLFSLLILSTSAGVNFWFCSWCWRLSRSCFRTSRWLPKKKKIRKVIWFMYWFLYFYDPHHFSLTDLHWSVVNWGTKRGCLCWCVIFNSMCMLHAHACADLVKNWLTVLVRQNTSLPVFTSVLKLIFQFGSFVLQVGFKRLQAALITLELLEVCLQLHPFHPFGH